MGFPNEFPLVSLHSGSIKWSLLVILKSKLPAPLQDRTLNLSVRDRQMPNVSAASRLQRTTAGMIIYIWENWERLNLP